MRLQNLLEGVRIKGAFHLGDLEISGVAYDSRKVKPNNLFIAIKGEKTDGNRFVDQARAHRASAVISEDPSPADFSGPWIQVTHSRKALAVIAAKFFGHPTGSLELVGITDRAEVREDPVSAGDSAQLGHDLARIEQRSPTIGDPAARRDQVQPGLREIPVPQEPLCGRAVDLVLVVVRVDLDVDVVGVLGAGLRDAFEGVRRWTAELALAVHGRRE